MDIVVPNSKYRQYVGVEKIKNLLERCRRITPLDATGAAGRIQYLGGTGWQSDGCAYSGASRLVRDTLRRWE